MTKKLGFILSLVPVWPQDLIDITGYILPGQAVGEVSPDMANPALECLWGYIATCLLHGLYQWDLRLRIVRINFPPPCRKKLLYCIQKGRVWWEGKCQELWVVDEPGAHQSNLCCPR